MAREPSNECCREPDKTVRLDQLVEIDAKQLHGNAEMASEIKVLNHLCNMVLLISVLGTNIIRYGVRVWRRKTETYPFPQVVQNLDLNQGLVVEPLFVANDLNRHRFSSAMVTTVQDLTKGPFPKTRYNFIPIGQMVTIDDLVIAPFVVVTKVVGRIFRNCHFLFALGSDAINRRVVENLLAFVIGQILGLAAPQNS